MTRVWPHRQPVPAPIVTASGIGRGIGHDPMVRRALRAYDGTEPTKSFPSYEWHAHATCRVEGADPELFFPSKGGGQHIEPKIAHYCGRCPVTAECLASAPCNEHGWYGGVSPRGRRKNAQARR